MSSAISAMSHVQRVRLLYKTCLKLHRGLPLQMKAIGDSYVKDEFRRHKGANEVQTIAFMEAWSGYALKLSRQLGLKGPHTARGGLGEAFSEKDLDMLNDEQLSQLFELYQETTKPVNSETDPHLAKP